jgi:hypothetical protein
MTTQQSRSVRGSASSRECEPKPNSSVSRAFVVGASHVRAASGCPGRSYPKPSIGSCAHWLRNWRSAKSPLAARSTHFSPPTAGDGSAMRPLRSTPANASARASPRSRRSGDSPSASVSSDFWPMRSNAASWDTKPLGSSRLVATSETVEAWVMRAAERTLRHLREEIDVAELLARWSDSTAVVPPSDADVRRVEELERAVVTGQMSAVPVPTTALTAPPANVTLRLRVRASTARDFRHWEAIYLRYRGPLLRNTTFLRFACELFVDTWRPHRADVAYARTYERDLYTCQRFCSGFRRLIRLATLAPPKADRAGLAGFPRTVAARVERDLFVPRPRGLGHVVPPRRHSRRADLCDPSRIEHPLEHRTHRAHRRRGTAANSTLRRLNSGIS